METARHRCRTRRKRGSSEPVVQEGQNTGSRSLAASAPCRQTSALASRAEGAGAHCAGPRGDRMRVSRRGLDHGAGGDDHAAVRDERSSGPYLVVDPSTFSLVPMAVRTSAPVGQTPVLHVTLTRDNLSALGAITTGGTILIDADARPFLQRPRHGSLCAGAHPRDQRPTAGHLAGMAPPCIALRWSKMF